MGIIVVVSPFVWSTCSCCENMVCLKHMTLLMVQGVVVCTSNENSGIDGSRSKSDPVYGIDSRLSINRLVSPNVNSILSKLFQLPDSGH